MSYPPHQDHNPYPSHNPGRYPQQDGYYGEPPRDRRYDDGADTVANIVRVVVGVVIAIFALHVLFVVFGATRTTIRVLSTRPSNVLSRNIFTRHAPASS